MEIITDDLIGKNLIISEEWYCDAIYCFGIYKKNDREFFASRKVRVNSKMGYVCSDQTDARIVPLSFREFEGEMDIFEEEEKKIVTKFKVFSTQPISTP